MSDRNPTEQYFKSKRLSIISAGLLALSTTIGVKAENNDSSIFNFQLEKPEFIPTIFFAITVYAIWNFKANWHLQTEIVREFMVNKHDHVITLGLCMLALITYFIDLIYKNFVNIIYFFQTPIEYLAQKSEILTVLFIVSATTIIAKNIISFLIKSSNIKDKKDFELEKIKHRNNIISTLLIQNKWQLLYDPKKNLKKQISFSKDGNIEKGRNNNENTWVLNNGFLEILNSKNEIYSRFKYVLLDNYFQHTNDADTLSIPNQKILLYKETL